jgi:hypothetical protein
MNRHTNFVREPFRPRIEQCLELIDGQLYWRGVVKSREDVVKRMNDFLSYADRDWFLPYSRDFADMIAGKLAEYDAANGGRDD